MSTIKILLVEGHRPILEHLSSNLREQFEWIWTASDPSEVLRNYAEIPFDVVISDGQGFLRNEFEQPQLREWCSRSSKMRLILMRYRSAATDSLQSSWENPVYFLPKPFLLEDIVGLIKSFSQEKEIEERRDSSPDVLGSPEGEIIMFGKLQHTPPPDLLQFICQMPGNYVCRFLSGGSCSSVHIQGNNLVDANSDEIRGAEAVFRILTLSTGSFDLTQTPRSVKRKIFEPVTSLILEGLRRQDETLRNETMPEEVMFALSEPFL